jgi:hypothetical protein
MPREISAGPRYNPSDRHARDDRTLRTFSRPDRRGIARLKEAYPDARTELRWEDPLQLLVATILSAQSTDVRVNQITGGLFEKYRTAEDYAEADPFFWRRRYGPWASSETRPAP